MLDSISQFKLDGIFQEKEKRKTEICTINSQSQASSYYSFEISVIAYLSSSHEFEHEVHAVLVVEDLVELDYVGVVDLRQDVHFGLESDLIILLQRLPTQDWINTISSQKRESKSRMIA